LKASKHFANNTVNTTIIPDEKNENEDYAKAIRKIPMWAKKPQQNNHKIIRAFFKIQEELGIVPLGTLVNRCSNDNYPDTYTTDFKGNFAQMKTDASNSHGKVFIVAAQKVVLWSEIENTLMKYKEDFIKEYRENANYGKITKDMIHTAYEYAKKYLRVI